MAAISTRKRKASAQMETDHSEIATQDMRQDHIHPSPEKRTPSEAQPSESSADNKFLLTSRDFMEQAGDKDKAVSESKELPSEPSDIIEVESSSSSLTLAWTQPERGFNNIENYEIKYREYKPEGAKWMSVITETSRSTNVVPDLKCGTEYEFKIRALTVQGEEGPFSASSVKMSTRQSLAKVIQMDAKKIKKGKDGYPSVFKLPLYQAKETTNHSVKTRKCVFGQESKNTKLEKTIMLVGATGSGKSTLIDGMINYITGVSWDDDFRFSLVDLTAEEKKKHSRQVIAADLVNHVQIADAQLSKDQHNDHNGYGSAAIEADIQSETIQSESGYIEGAQGKRQTICSVYMWQGIIEKNERKYGWEKRIQLFHKMREEAELVAKTSKSNYRPWGKDSDILSDDD